MTTLRERLAQMHAEATYGTPYGKVDARVAAALVAVADALRNAYDVGAVAEWIDVEGDGPKAALAALAAALGVSR